MDERVEAAGIDGPTPSETVGRDTDGGLAAGELAVVSPLAVRVGYTLRVATVALSSVSVGPFVPPEERSGQ